MPDTAPFPVQGAKAFGQEFIIRNRAAFVGLSDAIFYFGEPGMQEHRSAELLIETLAAEGFDIRRDLSGFPTGFMAQWGQGSPVIALPTEYDGNPNSSQRSGVAEREAIVPGAPGHCEGHNVNAAVTITAAITAARTMQKFRIPGALKVFGCPAEEQLISRPYYVRDGHFADVDVTFRNHVSSDLRTVYGTLQSAAISAVFTFHGETAHAAMAPWKGKSALDAIVLMDLGVAQYRERMAPRLLAHRTIGDGGEQPNILPERASVWWYFRGPTMGGAQFLFDQAKRIAKGAAMMANCTVAVDIRGAAWPVRGNQVAAEIVQKNIEATGMPVWTTAEQDFARSLQGRAGVEPAGLKTSAASLNGPAQPMPSSNDCGDISWVTPMAHVFFPGNIPNIDFHHWTAGAALATSIAHKGGIAGATVLAGSVIDVLTSPSAIARIKETFRIESGSASYQPLLANDQMPPVDLHRDVMSKFRSSMEAHYQVERPTFA